MSWPEQSTAISRFTRLGILFAVAGLLAGCFQPLYGERSLTGGTAVSDRLSAVDVIPIDVPKGRPEARIGVELRNALLFDISGGAATPSPTHRLKINLFSTRQSVIVDIYSQRPDVENYGLDVTFTLTEIATGKVVVTGQTFARVSYDVPGQQQRFARARGLRDAETRAAKVIADQIKSRLASYFVAGA